MEDALQVAIVDDDFRVLESLDNLLASAGYEVMPFESGQLFLNADCTDRIACLISDIGMPRVNGWDLLKIARSRRPNLPVILMTGRDDERPQSIPNDEFRFFRKPFDGVELLKALAAMIVTRK